MNIHERLLKGFPAGFTPKGGPKKISPGELRKVYSQLHGDQLRWNELEMEVELDGQSIGADDLELHYVYLSAKGHTISPENVVKTLVALAKERSYHPVREWLKRLESDDSIEPVDLSYLGRDYWGVQDDLANVQLKVATIGAVARMFEPGCKFDTMLVLHGKQGLRKSTSIKDLFGEPYFNDTAQTDPKDQKQAMNRAWVHEFAELDSITSKKQAGEVKALLSSSVDFYRAPYARAPVKALRSSVIWGTSNRDNFLIDPTGNRRFHVVHLPDQPIDCSKITRDRDRIWKAAVLAYRAGERRYLTQAEDALNNSRNESFVLEKPFVSQLAAWLRGDGRWGRTEPIVQPFTTNTALVNSGCRNRDGISSLDIKLAAEALKELGCDKKQRRVAGLKGYWWSPPSPVLGDSPVCGTPEKQVVGKDLNPCPICPPLFDEIQGIEGLPEAGKPIAEQTEDTQDTKATTKGCQSVYAEGQEVLLSIRNDRNLPEWKPGYVVVRDVDENHIVTLRSPSQQVIQVPITDVYSGELTDEERRAVMAALDEEWS